MQKKNEAIAWIVDSSKAEGVFTQDIQQFIASELFPTFVKNGIKYFITINASASAVTKMSVRSYSSKVGPAGMKLVEVRSVKDAITWLKANA